MIKTYKNGSDFIAENSEFLQHNKYLAVFFTLDAPLLIETNRANYALAAICGDKKLLAMKVEPYSLMLYGDAECAAEMAQELAKGYDFADILSAADDVGFALTQALQSVTGRAYEPSLLMDFLECKTKPAPYYEDVETAKESDADEICSLLERFIIDCGLSDTVNRDGVARTLGTYRLIRQDGVIASMAHIAPSDEQSLKVACVYTRDEYRGKGLARKVVTNITNEIIDDGKIATLNVDRNNPISYHLYASLGYKKLFAQSIFRMK